MAGSEATRARRKLASALVARYPDEAARLMEGGSETEIAGVLDKEAGPSVVAILERLSPDRAAGTLIRLSDASTRQVLAGLNAHRASSVLARMDPPVREQQLAVADQTTAEDLRQMAEYPAGTVGSFMDPRVTAFRPDTTVGDAVRRLKALGRQRVQDVFLVDADGRLVGVVPLQAIALASRKELLQDLSRSELDSAQDTWRGEAVWEQLERHRGDSLPVVDFDGRLVGVLRQDELLRTAEDKAAASMVAMVGAGAEERALSSPLLVVRKRLPWLQVNLLTAFLAAAVVGVFEDTIAQFTALAVLLPVVAGQSGNTGAQALAVTMRGLALREIRLRSWPRVAMKELVAGLLNGVAVATTTGAGVFLWSGSSGLAGVIFISMVVSMMLAGLSGATVPIVLSALRQDPAQSSSIVLTTVTDVAGFLSFLGIATLLSGTL
jgi:magnesium transporter